MNYQAKSITRVTGIFRLPLVIILALTVLFGMPSASFAQTDEDETGMLEEVTVTGTRKAGVSSLDTLSPVSVISGMELERQGLSDLTDALTKVTPSLSTQRFPIADGTAFVRPVVLRNLAPDQTLVLVDGTRRHRSALVNLQLAPLGTVNQGSQAVDFSAFPSSAITQPFPPAPSSASKYYATALPLSTVRTPLPE